MSDSTRLPLSEERGEFSLAPRAFAYLIVAGTALVAALCLQDAPLAAVGLPFVLALLVGVATDGVAAESGLRASLSVDQEAVLAGGTATITIELEAQRRISRCRVELAEEQLLRPQEEGAPDRPPEGSYDLDRPLSSFISLPSGIKRKVEIRATLNRAGEVRFGPVVLTCSGATGLYRRRFTHDEVIAIRARAHEGVIRALPRSHRVRVASGDRLSRMLGEGIELAEVRPERVGDRALRVNWRATARRREVHVTVRHPEKSTDVVVFADTFDDRAMPRVLEVAAAASAGYLQRRDRVGLVCFGGVLDWVEAGSGSRQLERIRARLAATRPFFSYAWKTIERIPPRAMPSGALLVAISPLRDQRITAALAELHLRGHDVVVVEVEDEVERPGRSAPPEAQAAWLLDHLEHEDLRSRLWLRGIAVATLKASEPVAPVFATLDEARRRMRPGARR